MRRDQNIESASAWLGANIFSLLTGAAFGYGAFLLLIDNAWQGMSFIIVAIAFARLCRVALPKDHKLQLWVTGGTIALAFAFLLYLISSMTLRFM